MAGIKSTYNSISEFIDLFKNLILKFLNKALIYSTLPTILLLIYNFGFEKEPSVENKILTVFEFILFLYTILLSVRSILESNKKNFKEKIVSEYLLILLLIAIILIRFIFPGYFATNYPLLKIFAHNFFIYFSILLVSLVEISRFSLDFYTISLNPARLFILSFVILILIGTGLLLLPKASTSGLSVIDALFTATSAVCVTGLIVVDTATEFTLLGKIIILCLFQAGGLGVMTFTSFFGFLFQGGFSFKNELFLQNFLNEDKIGEVFKSIFKIIFITLSIEMFAALLIFVAVPATHFSSFGDHLFFSVFHAISAFCNAGFSTLSNGLFESGFRFNYYFQLIIAFTIILGGLGFPIVFNFYKYLKHYIRNKFRMIIFKEKYTHSPRIININTKIVVSMTSILLLLGTVMFFISEYNNTLQDHAWNGKIVTSFFGSVTPRTAGFNTIDMTIMAPSTILIYLLLMWIGASPGSTGGGIKTTTFAVAVLNTISIAKGQTRVEIFRRELTQDSVQRSLSIIFLSLLIIGGSIFLLTISDSEKSLISIAFESISAFSTVGLTLGITDQLSFAGKLIIILTMLIGRVGVLTLIIVFINKSKSFNYKYPKESVFIN